MRSGGRVLVFARLRASTIPSFSILKTLSIFLAILHIVTSPSGEDKSCF